MSNTDRNGVANISACIEVPDGCHLECRIGAHGTVEFTFGTWQGGAEVHFERYALERFMELVTWSLDQSRPVDPSSPPLMMISHPTVQTGNGNAPTKAGVTNDG